MSGHGIPSVYKDATDLDADSNARLSLARAQYIALRKRSPAQADAVKFSVEVRGGYRVDMEGVRKDTFSALVKQGFVRKLDRVLTGLGLSLREAATYTRETPGP